MNLEALKNIGKNNLFDSFVARYRENQQMKVIIFGAGDQGMMTAMLLKENGIIPYCFCDNDIQKLNTQIKGLPVITPKAILSLGKNIAVINNDSYRHEKKEQLLLLGIPQDVIWMFDVFNPLYKGFTRQYMEEHYLEFEKIYRMLDDEKSKETLVGYLCGVCSADPQYYDEIAVKGEYFPEDIVPIRNDHVFLDVGAYNGDTIRKFIEFSKSYEKIYAFEPFESSAQLIQEKNFVNVELHVAAASDITGEKIFYCNDYGDLTMVTTVLEDGANHDEIRLDTVAIDDVLAGRRATFIKMDIEGSEFEALQGAQNTIQEYKPFLAICVYHKREDLIRIIPFLKDLVPEYKMYLRHHSTTGTDLVLYCKVNNE